MALSENEVQLRRKTMIAEYVRENGEPPKEITCDSCQDPENCPYCYDLYNTDGDCLAMK